MKGSELFVRCLENEGVESIFGIPGEETLDLMDSLSRSGIRFIVTRHEQSAAFMANMYGRMTHKPGVCLATLGPGATNLITGIADAHLDRAPMVAITGQGGLDRIHKESHQYIDIVSTFKSVTSWNKGVIRADFIPEIVSKAFDTAVSVPGAVHIELPEDIAADHSEKKPLLKRAYSHITTHDETELEKAAQMIEDASMPIILAGNGIARVEAAEKLQDFVVSTGIPVVTTFMGKGVISAEDEHYLGSMGIPDRDHIMCGFDMADLVICIGFDPVEYSPAFWNPTGSKTIIHIHHNHPDIVESYIPAISLVGDIKDSLEHLHSHCIFKKDISEEFRRIRVRMVNELTDFRENLSFPVKPQKILWDIRQCLPDDGILISDVGAHKLWIGRLFPALRHNTVFMSNGLASMGFALPAAITASIIEPEKSVIAVAGDGGFLMNVQELETAVRLGCSFVVVIFNDSQYGVIAWHEMKKFNQSTGTDFKNPDFVKLAESFGARGVKISKTGELQYKISQALEMGGVWIIDVEVDYSENLKLTRNLESSSCEIFR